MSIKNKRFFISCAGILLSLSISLLNAWIPSLRILPAQIPKSFEILFIFIVGVSFTVSYAFWSLSSELIEKIEMVPQKKELIERIDLLPQKKELIEKIEMLSSASLTVEGKADQAYSKVVKELQYAIRVQNTYIVDSRIPVYSPAQHSNIVENQKKFVEKGDNFIWEDIISDTKSGKVRIKSLEDIKDNPSYKLFKVQVQHKQFPVINFIILTYHNNNKSVWFGWGGYITSENDTVFRSNNIALVSLFENYFSALKCIDNTNNDKLVS